MDDDWSPFPEPIVVELGDTLDLHLFQPREVPDLMDDWLEHCREAGISEARVIHGRGKGVLRTRVHSILGKHPLVESFVVEPSNPGATLVRVKLSA